MIEKLEGTRETINFEDGTIIKLHDNQEVEDYPTHWHLPIEIIMPIKGHYGVRCGNTLYTLREEDILFLQPGVLHACIAPEAGRRYFCQISPPAPLISTKAQSAINLILPPVMLITPELDATLHAQVSRLLYRTYQQTNTASLLTDFTRYLLILQVIHSVYEFFEKHATHREPTENYKLKNVTLLQNACAYIQEEYAECITLDAISKRIGFSKFHFTRLFKSYTGESFYRYLNTARMSNAQVMLADADTSITHIAYAVGYTSMSSFIRMFKSFYGCTPSEYRRMLEKK